MQQWRSVVNFLSINHSVHPVEPSAPNHSEFLQINKNVRIRVIHVNGKNCEKIEEDNKPKRRSQNSVFEEYWFTRCNKPFNYQRCSCSFRRSQRLSALFPSKENETSIREDLNRQTNEEQQLKSIESFVENIIEDCLLNAFKEYASEKCSFSRGLQNLGFDSGEDCVDLGLQANLKPKDSEENSNLKEENQNSCVKFRNSNVSNGKFQSSNKKKQCKHSEKPLVILLHGIGASADIWWSVINSLSSNGYEVIAPDMLGHGYSSVPNHANLYKFKKLVKHTLAVYDYYVEASESRKIIIIAHSLGCSIATAVCRYKIQQVSELILISGGGPTPLAPPVDSEIPFISCLQSFLKPLLFCGVKRSLLYSSRGKYFQSCSDNCSAVPHYVINYIKKGQHWPEGDAAFHRKILVPTLLVYGLQDKLVTLVQECEMERTIPKSFLELIPNCGHLPMVETPDQLNHMILCFINWWSR